MLCVGVHVHMRATGNNTHSTGKEQIECLKKVSEESLVCEKNINTGSLEM